jgi:hypothetical protein
MIIKGGTFLNRGVDLLEEIIGIPAIGLEI